MSRSIKTQDPRAFRRGSAAFALRIAAFASIGLAALVGSLVVRPNVSSAGPSGSAEAVASAAPSSSAAPAASGAPDAGPPPLPKFDAEPFSAEKSPKPTPADWKPATPVALTQGLAFGCNAYRVREWIKIRCSSLATSEIAMLTGPRDDVMLFIDPPASGQWISAGGELIFPVRRGDRRVFEWSTFGEAYDGPGFPQLSFLISESWAPDEPSPRIIAW